MKQKRKITIVKTEKRVNPAEVAEALARIITSMDYKGYVQKVS